MRHLVQLKIDPVAFWRNPALSRRAAQPLALRLTFKERVDALLDKLAPRPDGTGKKLVGVDRLSEFLETFTQEGRAAPAQPPSAVGTSPWAAIDTSCRAFPDREYSP